MSINRSLSYDLTQLKDLVKQKNHSEIKKIVLAAMEDKGWGWYKNDHVLSAVRDAIIAGDVDSVKIFFDDGKVYPGEYAKIDDSDNCSRNFIYFAVKNKQLPIVQYLANHIDFEQQHKRGNERDDTAILYAVEEGFSDIVAFLLSQGANARAVWCGFPRKTVLAKAASNDDFVNMEALLAHGADEHIETSLHLAHEQHSQEIEYYERTVHKYSDENRRQLVKETEKETCSEFMREYYNDKLKEFDEKKPILEKKLQALKNTYYKLVKNILNYAVGVDLSPCQQKYGNYGLSFLPQDISGMNFCGISVNGQPVTRKMLLEEKKNGIEDTVISLQDVEKIQDLHIKLSIQNQLQAMFKKRGKLIDQNGIVNLVPLWRAAEIGDCLALQVRLAAGCNPNEYQPDDSDKTPPLVSAAKNGHGEIINLLLTHPTIDKKSFRLAIRTAQKNNHNSIAKTISEAQEINSPTSTGTMLSSLSQNGLYTTEMKEYIESFNQKIPNSQFLQSLNPSSHELELLQFYYDDISGELINIPVLLNHKVYDIKTLQSLLNDNKPDPFTKKRFHWDDIKPAKQTAKAIEEALQQIKLDHDVKDAKEQPQNNVSSVQDNTANAQNTTINKNQQDATPSPISQSGPEKRCVIM